MGKAGPTIERFVMRARGGAVLLLAAVAFGAPRAGQAHIVMTAPADWLMTSSEGDPQKIPPCGVDPTTSPSASTYTPTNKVTTVHVGDQLTVNWQETIPHDGHFRISLAINSRSELTDPAVTASNSDGTPMAVAISSAYPVLADNLFPHQAASTPVGMTYSYTVTIPNTPCAKCTLQLLQFMAEHPADPSYFYHHCADLTILAKDTSSGTGGTGAVAATGGTMGGAGGTTGGAGGTTGGAGGTTGGTGGTTGGAGGTTGGTGGTLGGTGGRSAAAGGTSGAVDGVASPSASGGCSCRVAPAGAGLGGLGLTVLASLLACRRRRARR